MPQAETDALIAELRANPDKVRKWCGLPSDATPEDIEFCIQQSIQRMEAEEYWRNDKYQVSIFEQAVPDGFPAMLHLSIKRHDRSPVFSWRDIQSIKNELVGPEHEAVQLFPAESRLVDGANQYHLFAFREPGVRFPFGFPNRVVGDEPLGKARNRPLEK